MFQTASVFGRAAYECRIIRFVALVVIAGTVFMNEAVRRIRSIMHDVRGTKCMAVRHTCLSGQSGGSHPIIFAVSLVLLPSLMGGFLQQLKSCTRRVGEVFHDRIYPNGLSYNLIYFLVIGFTYFYTAITFNPQKVRRNPKVRRFYSRHTARQPDRELLKLYFDPDYARRCALSRYPGSVSVTRPRCFWPVDASYRRNRRAYRRVRCSGNRESAGSTTGHAQLRRIYG